MRRSSRTNAKVTKYQKDFDEEEDGEDFVDSGSDASIPEDADTEESDASSSEEFTQTVTPKPSKKSVLSHKKSKPNITFQKKIFNKIKIPDITPVGDPEISFSVKDLTEEEKKLPEFLNLSESDSDDDDDLNDKIPKVKIKIEKKSDDDEPMDKPCIAENITEITNNINIVKPKSDRKSIGQLSGSDTDSEMEDVLPNQILKPESNVDSPIENKILPKKLNFQQLHESSVKLEEAKKSLELYNKRLSTSTENAFNVNDLLAMGETEDATMINDKNDSMSDSDVEDLEEVQVLGEPKARAAVPKGGIQVTVDIPMGTSKTKKKLDIEMMMKRRINRVKKEYQVYMHKVHILSWIAHGNHINKVINNELIMAKALSLIPSEQCYPENRVNIKYLEQIVKWYSETVELNEDKSELRYKANKIPLNVDLLNQIRQKNVTSKKNKVLIFISMLRALGINCRLVLTFQVLPLHPPTTELCSLSTKNVKKDDKNTSKQVKASTSKVQNNKPTKPIKKPNKSKLNASEDIPQLDGADDNLMLKNKRTSARNKLNVSKNNSSNVEKKVVKKEDDQSSSSNLSHWDKITQGLIDKEPGERVSHKDLLIKSRVSRTKSKLETSKFFDDPQTTAKSNKSDSTKKKTLPTKVTNKNGNDELLTQKPKRTRPSTSKIDITKSDKDNKKNKSENVEINSATAQKMKKVVSKDSKSSRYFKNENDDTTNNKKKGKGTDNDLASPSTSKMTENCKRVKNPNPIIKNKLKLPDVSSTIRKRRLSNASDGDFKPTKRRSSVKKVDKIDRRVLSSDDENISNDKKKRGVNIWCEVYVEEEEQWISVDVIKGEVHCSHQIYTRSKHPVSYIVAWDTTSHVKDVTRRYVPHWNTITRRLRVDPEWYTAALKPWMGPSTLRDKREDQDLDRMQLDAPMPQTIFEFKNHPLYVLKRHLLKFEVIYPTDSMILGFVKNEPVYARECVHTCRSRETWVKEAKVVRAGEQPYKIVKARPKYDKLSGQMITDIPLEVFGPWQVDDYVPPKAENGLVPRNPYGNVELFKPCMLPEGTVHLVLPGLNKVARKLGIDCASAMIGFDYHSGGSHPLYDGFVVCEEFKDQIVEAWEKEQIEAELRARDKIEKRVYGNWKKLIRGLFIRRKLQNKYDFQSLMPENQPSNSKSNKRNKEYDRSNKKPKISDDSD